VRDPYEVLGVARGASLAEIKSAYRRASKSRHPDMGGSHEAMTELNTVYAFILNELKSGRSEHAQTGSGRADGASAEAGSRNSYRGQAADDDIDEELERLRRAAESLNERMRAKREEAWTSGDRVQWAKLTWQDLARFFADLARGGIKGLATLFAALIGVGSILVEANMISTLVILGSGIGLFVSLAMKSDKGGFMSAGLLLFGLATIWLPDVRAALFGWPVATISILICLALIFKFVSAGGMVGLLTGGLLCVFMISVILDTTERQRQPITPDRQPVVQPAYPPPQTPGPNAPAQPGAHTGSAPPPSTPTQQASLPPPATPAPSKPEPPQIRELNAARGAILKFVSGVPYQLKVRSGMQTRIVAKTGTIAFYRGDTRDGDCQTSMEFAAPLAASPYQNVDRLIRACDGDAMFVVQ
jgi:hypothetical protein